MTRSLCQVVALLLVAACARPDVVPTARTNDHRGPAGRFDAGALRIDLVARMARWHPLADTGAVIETPAFAAGRDAPEIPGPMIRVPAGTEVRASVRNDLADTLLVIGLGAGERAGRDTLRLAPGARDSIATRVDTPGTYLYYGLTLAAGDTLRGPGQLLGAFIVDSAGAAPDRVLVLSIWNGVPYPGNDDPFIMAINGKAWPFTERLELDLGDTLRLRVINGSRQTEHPMHLHGFYYRVDARGTWHADTLLAPAERRDVVTETMRGRHTMSLTWVPDRPGNWLFHCHVAFHMDGRMNYSAAGLVPPDEPDLHGVADHLFRGMSGLVTGIRVRGPAPPLADPAAAAQRLRITTTERSGYWPDGTEVMAYHVSSTDLLPADSVLVPGPPLVLRRGVPAAITVVNRMARPTGVHWHGLELDSYYDGVAGWSGYGTRVAPMVAPGDSFVALMTPPRAGTFIYHSHVDDARQLNSGLLGPLLVLEPGARHDPTLDHVWFVHVAGSSDTAAVVLNGGRPLPVLRAGVTNRIRLVSMTAGDEFDLELRGGDGLVTWRPVAKDGADLRPSQAVPGPASLHAGPGETWDFEWRPAPGRYRLVMNTTFNDFEVEVRAR